jgi:hypothetical protein
MLSNHPENYCFVTQISVATGRVRNAANGKNGIIWESPENHADFYCMYVSNM